MAFGGRGMPRGFQSLLNTKYAILQQQADAASTNAGTNAVVGRASANLDNTRAGLLPGESAASIRKSDAETGLIGEQSKYFGKEALARIALNRSSAGLNDVQAAVERRLGLSENPALTGNTFGETAVRSYAGYRLPKSTIDEINGY